jgi:hypothetical protein
MPHHTRGGANAVVTAIDRWDRSVPNVTRTIQNLR